MISKKYLDYRITELEAKMFLLEEKLNKSLAKPKKVSKTNGKKVQK